MADAPEFNLNREDLAWAAGFFDGEGTVRFKPDRRGGKNSGTVAMSVHQVRREPLVRFQRALGGMGKIGGPYPTGRENPILSWYATGWKNSQAIVAMLWPFLSVPKREQAIAAFKSL